MFAAKPFNCGKERPRNGGEPFRADLDYALRRYSAAKPWIVFDREYEHYKEAQNRPATIKAECVF